MPVKQVINKGCVPVLVYTDELESSAYRDIDQVMANQSDLVEVVHALKQLVCVKG